MIRKIRNSMVMDVVDGNPGPSHPWTHIAWYVKMTIGRTRMEPSVLVSEITLSLFNPSYLRVLQMAMVR